MFFFMPFFETKDWWWAKNAAPLWCESSLKSFSNINQASTHDSSAQDRKKTSCLGRSSHRHRHFSRNTAALWTIFWLCLSLKPPVNVSADDTRKNCGHNYHSHSDWHLFWVDMYPWSCFITQCGVRSPTDVMIMMSKTNEGDGSFECDRLARKGAGNAGKWNDVQFLGMWVRN